MNKDIIYKERETKRKRVIRVHSEVQTLLTILSNRLTMPSSAVTSVVIGDGPALQTPQRQTLPASRRVRENTSPTDSRPNEIQAHERKQEA